MSVSLYGVCPVCGRIITVSTTTSGNVSSYRKDTSCRCSKEVLIQRKYPDQQQEKYSHANPNRR